MGDDDRRGRASRPGGRAPWERYPSPESGENAAAPRNRRTDEPKPTKQLTVQDLVQRVDSERTTRRRKPDTGEGRAARGAGAGRAAQPERSARQPGNRSRTTDDGGAPPNAGTGANRTAPRGGRTARPAAAPPGEPAGRTRNAPPAPPGRNAASGAPNTAPATDETAAPGTAPRGRKSVDPRAAQGDRAAGPEQTARRTRPASRRNGPDQRRPTAAPAVPESQAPGRAPAAPPGNRGAAAASAVADAQPTTVYRAPAADASAPAAAPVAEQVTDQLPMPDDESGSAATSSAAEPEPEEKPKLSRLAESRKRRRRRVRIAGRSAGTLCAVIALLATGVGWNYLRATDNGFTQVSALDQNSADVVDAAGQTGDENFLIVGTDTRAGVDSQLGAGTTDDAEGARSDTVMLVHVPANRSRVVAVSFPRDLDVSRPECEGWDNDKAKYTDGKFPAAIGDKLNATYALGGPKCLTKVIQKMSGLNINHFVGIDFSGFQSMVDTIGGVEVCTNRPLVDDELGTVLPNPGRQKLNGPIALDYVRARHVHGEERSDYDRIHRQQLFLSSLLRGALSSRVLFDIGKLNGFINAFSSHAFMDHVTTRDLLMLGRSMQKMDAGAITFLTVPTAGTTSYGNEIPRESDIKAIFQAVIDDQPLPGEKKAPETPKPSQAPAAPPQLSAVDPSTVSVQVSNGSGVTGVAGTAATRFGAEGFQIYNVGNYSGGTIDTTTVRYSAGHEAEAATVASALPGAKLAVAPGLGSIVEVALGADFTGTVGTPAAFGTPVPAPSGAADSTEPVALPSDLEHVNAADDLCN